MLLRKYKESKIRNGFRNFLGLLAKLRAEVSLWI